MVAIDSVRAVAVARAAVVAVVQREGPGSDERSGARAAAAPSGRKARVAMP